VIAESEVQTPLLDRLAERFKGNANTTVNPILVAEVRDPTLRWFIPPPRMNVQTNSVAGALKLFDNARVTTHNPGGGSICMGDLGIHSKEPGEAYVVTGCGLEMLPEVTEILEG
jgi:hypothetical protein